MKNKNVKADQPPIGHQQNRWRKAVIAAAFGGITNGRTGHGLLLWRDRL